MKHAVLSASSSHRWLACPGSIDANKNKVHTDNVYALEGTSAHALLEVCLRLGTEPQDYVGKFLQKGHMVIDEAMADGVGYALDYVKAYLANNPKAMVHVEHEVHYGRQIGLDEDDDPEDELAYGTSDVIIDNFPKECVILDYKHGIGISVSVQENSQLRLYGVGMRHQRGRYQKYRQVVVQPRVPRRKPVQEAVLTDAQLVTWINDVVKPVVPIALSGKGQRVAGDHCKYCKDDGKCKAQYHWVQEKASKQFKKAEDPKALTPAEVGELLDLSETLIKIASKVKECAVADAHAGVEIPGWHADWTAPRRCWPDEEKANEHLASLGLETEERYSVELISPAAAEKALKAKGKWPKKQRGVKEAITPIDEIVGYTESNPTIAKGPAKAK